MSTKKKSGSKKPDPKKNGQAGNGSKKKTPPQANSGQAWERGESVACSPNQADPLEKE